MNVFQGFSVVFALAEYIYQENYFPRVVRKCWRNLQAETIFEVRSMHPANYRNAYRALYMFYMKIGKARTRKIVRFTLYNMDSMKKFLFMQTTPSSELSQLTKWYFEVATESQYRPPRNLKYAEVCR
ncbi:hypothetical protein ElyMa_001783800 [Elysia marginata]|uniref:Uncharacterized protein n=1 Tax=Elysia marginata TaxID=1093978 RepID=A0AAV4EFC5_9GAST|nr:hypothetical protein ElyMa_001783800 [Elysia marginata]